MKQWRYTGKVYAIEDFDWVYFPIGCDKGFGAKGDSPKVDFTILDDGRLAGLEEAEFEWTEET